MRDNVKKSRPKTSQRPPSPQLSLDLAIRELVEYTDQHDAEFMADSIFSYAIGSKAFVKELDDFDRADHYRFFSLMRQLVTASYSAESRRIMKLKF